MRRLASIITLLGISPISLLIAWPVLAFPSLPSSFYGTVKVDGADVPDGILVQALINGKIITEIRTQTYQEHSFYSLEIPGDDPSTPVVEGGREGDTISFMIGKIVADQTGIWKSGTIVSLDLSAWSAVTLTPAQVTPMIAVLTPDSSLPTAMATDMGKSRLVSSTTSLYIGVGITGFILLIIVLTILWLILIRKPKVE